MDDAIAFLVAMAVALAVIVVATLIVMAVVKTSRRYRENLEHAAGMFGGTVQSSFWKGRRIELVHEGVPGQLAYFAGTDKAPPWTRMRLNWVSSGRLRIVPEGFFARLRKAFGAEDIQIGNPRFDERYLVQGAPRDWVRKVLDRPLQDRLERLSELGASFWRGRGIRLDIGPAGVTLFCQRNLAYERDQLVAFMRDAIEILQHFRKHAGELPEVISVEEHIRKGECPVCGTGLEGKIRKCSRCRTPHHRECWKYFGGCAIYACGSRDADPKGAA